MSDEVQPDAATDTTTTDETRPDAEAIETDENADNFPRSYVENLRRESAGYRDKARSAETRSDELARELFTARVAATGMLADPRDLPYDPEWLDNDQELRGAIAALLDDKPHLKARTVTGDVGQGRRGAAEAPISLVAELKNLV
jgi:hypothetical protein